jgi:hypothetical protein
MDVFWYTIAMKLTIPGIDTYPVTNGKEQVPFPHTMVVTSDISWNRSFTEIFLSPNSIHQEFRMRVSNLGYLNPEERVQIIVDTRSCMFPRRSHIKTYVRNTVDVGHDCQCGRYNIMYTVKTKPFKETYGHRQTLCSFMDFFKSFVCQIQIEMNFSVTSGPLSIRVRNFNWTLPCLRDTEVVNFEKEYISLKTEMVDSVDLITPVIAPSSAFWQAYTNIVLQYVLRHVISELSCFRIHCDDPPLFNTVKTGKRRVNYLREQIVLRTLVRENPENARFKQAFSATVRCASDHPARGCFYVSPKRPPAATSLDYMSDHVDAIFDHSHFSYEAWMERQVQRAYDDFLWHWDRYLANAPFPCDRPARASRLSSSKYRETKRRRV